MRMTLSFANASRKGHAKHARPAAPSAPPAAPDADVDQLPLPEVVRQGLRQEGAQPGARAARDRLQQDEAF